MRRGLALVLVAATLTGCVSLGEVRDRIREELAGEGPRFGPEIPMEQPSMGAEPNLAILPGGAIFVTAVAGSQERPNALEGAAWLWRSVDGGDSWETLRAPARDTPLGTPQLPNSRRPFGSSDADVAASSDGWIYYTDWWNWGAPVAGTPRTGNYLVERSNDNGATWEATPVTGPDGTNVDRQWLVAGEGGFVGLAYNWFNDPRNLGTTPLGPGGSELRIVVSRDHGATFEGPFVVAPTGPDVGYVIAKPFIVPLANGTELDASVAGGALVFPYFELPWSANLSAPAVLKVAHSLDGESWTATTVAEDVVMETIWPLQGASWGEGRATLAWNARDGDGISLFASHLEGIGADATEWTAPARIVSGGTTFLPWVAGDAESGRVAVGAYFSNATGRAQDAPNETEWRLGIWESGTPLANASFERVFASEVVKRGPLCPEGAACASNRELLDYAAVAYGPDGRLHAAWARSRENPEAPGALIGHVHYAGSLR